MKTLKLPDYSEIRRKEEKKENKNRQSSRKQIESWPI